jgi:hypothetical protein
MKTLKYVGLVVGLSNCGGDASQQPEDNRQAFEQGAQPDSGAGPVSEPNTTVSDTDATVDLDLSTCNELKKFPGEALYDVVQNTSHCDTDADCEKGFTLSSNVCVASRCGGYSGSSSYKAALEAAFEDPDVSTRCEQLRAGNCFRFPASCPPPPSEPRSYLCVEGACVAQ